MNRMSGWWRKLNQPLVSEVLRIDIWVSLVFCFICLILFAVINIHARSDSFAEVYGVKIEGMPDISHMLALSLIFFYMIMNMVLLLFSKEKISAVPFFRWLRNEKIKYLTVMRPFYSIIILILVALLCSFILPAMHWIYDESVKNEIILEAVKDNDFPLSDDWLSAHDIPIQQYAQTREDVIQDGWDRTSELTNHHKKVVFFMMIYLYASITIVLMGFITDVYFVWRFYPRSVGS